MIGSNFIDLSYSEIDLYSGYNTWNWIERDISNIPKNMRGR
jgi:hypothetical protein